MRKVLVAALASSALLLPSSEAVAAKTTVDVKIDKKVAFEITGPDYSQVAVSLKVKCDPSLGTIALNVQVFQGSVSGFGFVPSVTCTGKWESVVAHVQSNFGSVYVPGPANVVVTDFVRGTTFQQDVIIG